MVSVTFVGKLFTITDNDAGTVVAPVGRHNIEEERFIPNGDVRADRLYANIDVLRGVYTDFDAPGLPLSDEAAFVKAVDEYVADCIREGAF